MKSIAIARKIIREYFREPLLLGLIFTFPVILLLFYFIAFGETDQGMAKHLKIMVINQDQGIQSEGQNINMGHQLIQAIRLAEFEGDPIFDIFSVGEQGDAEIALREHKAAALIVIPEDFSQLLHTSITERSLPEQVSITLRGYPTSDLYVFSKSILIGLIAEFGDRLFGGMDDHLELSYSFIPGTGTMSDFEFGVPGLIVFGIMFLTISTAMTMVREEVNGTLRRLRLSNMGAKEMILGVTGAQILVGILLVPFIFGCAMLMGFRGSGSILLAMVVSILLCMAAVGLGFITACIARNDGEAANLGAVVGVMMVIVSGAMYPMPRAPLAVIGGRTIQVYDLLPPALASEALRRILIFGDSIGDLVYEILGLLILSIIIFLVGIVMYQKLKLEKSSSLDSI